MILIKMQSKAKLIQAIMEELAHIPEEYLPTVHKMIHKFRAEVSPEKIHSEKDKEYEWTDEIKKVQEQHEQIRQDKFGNQSIT